MAFPQVGNVAYPTPEEILSQLLSDVRYGYANIGVNVNVSRGSELYIRMKALANRVSIAISNNEISLRDISPLDATGDVLTELAGVYGVARRAASAGAGNVIVSVSGGGTVTIPAGFICTSPDGIQYKTTVSSTVSDNQVVAVSAVAAGDDTNQVASAIMTWDSAIVGNLGQNCTVDPGGIDGGAAADSDEVLRARLIERLSFPAEGGNWAQVKQLAENSSSSVQSAFVYTAVRGPASYDVALIKAGTDRQLSLTSVNTVATGMLTEMPGSADLNCTAVSPEYVDAVIDTRLALPVNAGGAGGGWRDATPWPSVAEAAGVYAQVTSVANLLTSSEITVDSTAADPPKAGDRFGIWNPAGGTAGDGEMAEVAILSVGGLPSAYTITIDTAESDAISFITTGMYCSAGAVSLKAYGASFLAAVQTLGPGEKTVNTDIIPRGARKPGPDLSYPITLSSLTLSSVTNSYNEILSMSFSARFATGTTTPLSSPTVPATTADAPNVLVLTNLSFRRLI
jgi:uncharacterized phage protein gp47/JayE